MQITPGPQTGYLHSGSSGPQEPLQVQNPEAKKQREKTATHSRPPGWLLGQRRQGLQLECDCGKAVWTQLSSLRRREPFPKPLGERSDLCVGVQRQVLYSVPTSQAHRRLPTQAVTSVHHSYGQELSSFQIEHYFPSVRMLLLQWNLGVIKVRIKCSAHSETPGNVSYSCNILNWLFSR